MNSLERIGACIGFHETDRVPVIPQVFGHAAVIEGVPLDAYVQNGDLIARCQTRALERYGHDAVFTVMDVNVEAEAIGASVRYLKDAYPVIDTHPFTAADDWSTCPLPDPELAGRMPEMLKALRLLRSDLGDRVLVVGCVVGPLTLAAQLFGAEEALYLAIDKPDRFCLLLDFSAEIITRFGIAQIDSGAHLPLVFDPFASPAVVPPQLFREFELPRLEKVFAAFAQRGAVANWLHIAGPAQPILPLYPAAGVDIANFDYCVAPGDAQTRLPATCLDGNVKPMSFIERDPEDIFGEASLLLRSFERRGGFILSSGCEIPPESRPENVAALVEAVKSRR